MYQFGINKRIIQVFTIRKTCTCSFMVYLSYIHRSSLAGVRMCLILYQCRVTISVSNRCDLFATIWFMQYLLTVLLTNRPRLRTHTPAHSYGNQRLQWQFEGLLMMGNLMPETCWAVSVQGSKFYDCLLHLVGCFVRVSLYCLIKICCSTIVKVKVT
jgi:hypothetical protein